MSEHGPRRGVAVVHMEGWILGQQPTQPPQEGRRTSTRPSRR